MERKGVDSLWKLSAESPGHPGGHRGDGQVVSCKIIHNRRLTDVKNDPTAAQCHDVLQSVVSEGTDKKMYTHWLKIVGMT